jgi:hypothetical protein
MAKTKLNLGNLGEATGKENKTPIQQKGDNGVVADEEKRTSFITDADTYKQFKSYLIRNEYEIKNFFDIKIREIIQLKNINKEDFKSDLTGATKSLGISKSLLQQLTLWLNENDLHFKSVMNKIILDALAENKKVK